MHYIECAFVAANFTYKLASRLPKAEMLDSKAKFKRKTTNEVTMDLLLHFYFYPITL